MEDDMPVIFPVSIPEQPETEYSKEQKHFAEMQMAFQKQRRARSPSRRAAAAVMSRVSTSFRAIRSAVGLRGQRGAEPLVAQEPP